MLVNVRSLIATFREKKSAIFQPFTVNYLFPRVPQLSTRNNRPRNKKKLLSWIWKQIEGLFVRLERLYLTPIGKNKLLDQAKTQE